MDDQINNETTNIKISDLISIEDAPLRQRLMNLAYYVWFKSGNQLYAHINTKDGNEHEGILSVSGFSFQSNPLHFTLKAKYKKDTVLYIDQIVSFDVFIQNEHMIHEQQRKEATLQALGEDILLIPVVAKIAAEYGERPFPTSTSGKS